MPIKKPLYVSPADSKAAKSVIEEISTRIEKTPEDQRDNIKKKIKRKLIEVSNENASLAMAMLEQLSMKYPYDNWED